MLNRWSVGAMVLLWERAFNRSIYVRVLSIIGMAAAGLVIRMGLEYAVGR